ncbi:MAG TPA: hypothetical protein VGP94_10895 [Tepidisphaeraceae bacterium]|jgi:hypothetical protein|nr:hypothetical protein [Tepidisphaeraceae bacterium]
MRFWLKWAIVALPVVGLILLWIDSYRLERGIQRESFNNEFNLISNRGLLCFGWLRDNRWRFANGIWSYWSRQPFLDRITQNQFLGFGYETATGPTLSSRAATVLLPMWSLTVIAMLPPLGLVWRERKKKRSGFPVAPVDVSSKESTPAQTG